jgi:phenylacetate-CoA ligase
VHPARPGRAYTLLSGNQQRSADELRAVQVEALRELLRAAQAVPFYRERLVAVGLEPDGVRAVEDLAELPPLERSDLQRLGIAGLGVAGRSGLRIPTSGSTGQPVRILRPLETGGWIDAVDRRAREWSGVYRPGQRSLAVTHTRAMVTAGKAWHYRRAIVAALENTTTVYADQATDPKRLQRLAGSLGRRPAVIVRGVSNCLYTTALALERAGLSIRAGACWSGGNHLPEHHRLAVEAAFACPVYERYGAWEAGAIAHQCPEERLFHVASENVLVEIVRPDGRPVAPGERGHILVTPLRNRAMPLLRYRIGDLAEAPLESGCACGRPLPLLGKLLGRSNDLLRTAAGWYAVPEAISNQMRRAWESVLDFQVVQRDDLALDVRVVQRDDPPPEPFRRRLALALDDVLGMPGATHVERVEEIPLTGAGKLRHVVSLAADQERAP